MKKIFSVLLIIAMLLGTLALVACETPAENNSEQPAYTNEVELMLLGSRKTSEAFAEKNEFATFLKTVKNPKVDLTADLTELAGVSLDASLLYGDDFVGLLLNELTFPMGSDDFVPSGAPASSTVSDIGAYFTKEELALSVPMLFGEGYYGIKYDNILTFLESIMGEIPEDERAEVEAIFNNMLNALKNVSAPPALPQGFTAFLSGLMKEKLSLTKTEANGNTVLSFNLTAKGSVDVLEGAISELRKDTAWKEYLENVDSLLKISNDEMSIDSVIAEMKESFSEVVDSYTVSNVYDSQYRIVENKIVWNNEGSRLDVLKTYAQYGELSKFSVSISVYEESFDDGVMTKEGDIVLYYEEKQFTDTQKGFSLRLSLPNSIFGGMGSDYPLVGEDDEFYELSVGDDADENIVVEINCLRDSANDDFKLSLALNQGTVKMFDVALVGKLKLDNNALTFSVTKLEMQNPEQPGMTVSMNMNVSIKIAEMTAEDKVIPTYKDFSALPPEVLDAIKGMLGGGSIG